MKLRLTAILLAVFVTLLFPAPVAFASCSSPAGNAGDIVYSTQWRTVQYCNGGAWVSAGPATYAAPAVNCNGSTTYLNVAAANGAASGMVTGSFWVQRTNPNSTVQVIYSTDRKSGGSTYNTRFQIEFNASNQLEIIGRDDSSSAGATQLDVTTAATFTDNNWHQILFSVDLSSASNRSIYIDDALDASTWGTYVIGGTIHFEDHTSNQNSAVCAIPNGSSFFYGNLADPWLDIGTFTDFSVTANRRLFRDASGNPVYLGAAGATPLGTPPNVYLTGPASGWYTNKGTGGGFTLNGTLSNAGDTSGYGSSLVAYWKFDDGSGTSAADSSGNGDTGTLTGTVLPVWTTGKINGALDFSGLNSTNANNVSAATDPFDGLSTVTATAWIYTRSSGAANSGSIFNTQGTTLSCHVVGAGASDASATTILCSSDGGTTWATLGSNALVPYMNTWAFFAVTRDPAGYVTMYINGVQTGVANQFAGTPVFFGTYYYSNYLSIGAEGTYNGFDGKIDEFRVYGRILSAADIAALYNPTTGCASSGGAGTMFYNSDYHVPQYCNGSAWLPMGPVPGTGGSGCTGPVGAEGNMIYNSDKTVEQYCDGTNWIALGGAPSIGTTTGLVGWWKFDETSGSSASDSSGNGNTGTLINGPAWTTSGKVNGALQFTYASNQYVDVGNAAGLNFERTQPFSIAAWGYFLPAFPNSSAIISRRLPTGPFQGFTLYDNTGNNNLYFALCGVADSSCNAGIQVYSPNNSLSLSTWHHVVMTYDGSSTAAGVKMYIDGVNQTLTATYDALASSTLNSGDMQIGVNAGGTYCTGTLDDIRVYNRVLTASEISDLYHATGGP